MKTFAILAALAVVAGANAQFTEQDGTSSLHMAWSASLGDLPSGHTSHPPSYAYDNTTTPTGSGYINGGAAGATLTTKYVTDQVSYSVSGFGGQTVTRWQWSVVNFSTTDVVTARMRIRVHQDAAGAPGAYITGFSFTPIAFAANTAYAYYIDLPGFVLPASGKIWMGETFDNSGAAATTAAQLNSLGQLLYNPPTAGASTDSLFSTTAASVGNVNNPVGSSFNFGGAPVANLYGRLEAVPEPATMAILGLGAAALIRRRRKA